MFLFTSYFEIYRVIRFGNPKETGIDIIVIVVKARMYIPKSLMVNKLANNTPLINANNADKNFTIKLPIAAVLICLLLKTFNIGFVNAYNTIINIYLR